MLIVTMFGALVIGGILGYVNVSMRVSAMSQDRVEAYYAADAGVELVLSDLADNGILDGIAVIPGVYPWTGDSINGYSSVTINVSETSGVPSPPPPPDYPSYDDYLIVSSAGDVTITCYTRYCYGAPWPLPDAVIILSWDVQ